MRNADTKRLVHRIRYTVINGQFVAFRKEVETCNAGAAVREKTMDLGERGQDN